MYGTKKTMNMQTIINLKKNNTKKGLMHYNFNYFYAINYVF